jgi:hypothetical protein
MTLAGVVPIASVQLLTCTSSALCSLIMALGARRKIDHGRNGGWSRSTSSNPAQIALIAMCTSYGTGNLRSRNALRSHGVKGERPALRHPRKRHLDHMLG